PWPLAPFSSSCCPRERDREFSLSRRAGVEFHARNASSPAPSSCFLEPPRRGAGGGPDRLLGHAAAWRQQLQPPAAGSGLFRRSGPLRRKLVPALLRQMERVEARFPYR